jgi:hypothetical protein
MMFSTMRFVRAEIVKKGFTSSADPDDRSDCNVKPVAHLLLAV